nr:glycosyltransferase family 4 protein [Chloroflexota bacterium]
MRVLMVSHTYLPAEYRGKLRWLATQGGVSLTLAALSMLRLPTGSQLTFEKVAEPFEVKFLQPLAFAHNNTLRCYAPAQVMGLLQETKPAIVHAEAEPHSLTLALLACLKPRFGYRLVAFTWENRFLKGRGPLRWLERFTLRRVDWMIAGNKGAVDVVRWRGYAGSVTVIPQVGLNPAHYEAALPHPALSINSFRIGFVGRLVSEKGVMDLFEAFIPLAQYAVLILIGEGPLRALIQERAAAAGIADRVHCLGFVAYSEMPAYLKSLEVLVLPSRTMPFWMEQFGHVLAEAMLAGTPVIGSDSGAIPEVIGDAGLIFPEGDVGALRERLTWLIEHPEERKQLAEAGKRRALAHFTDEAIAKATLQVYQAFGSLK